MNFDALQTKNEIVDWIENWFLKNGSSCVACVAISGGKDSSVVAALCVEALGKDNVIGVLMPNGVQDDIDYSHMLVKHLGIKSFVVDIGVAYKALTNSIDKALISVNYNNVVLNNPSAKLYDFNSVYWNNTPARLRMTTLYGIAAIVDGRVANTCNLSEDWVGYSTKYGDSAGDFSPLSDLTVTEVKELGYQLGLPQDLIEKVPADGLCGQTDEDRLGFTYAVLDRYIRTGEIEDLKIKARIDEMHAAGLHKLRYMDGFKKPVETIVRPLCARCHKTIDWEIDQYPRPSGSLPMCEDCWAELASY